MKSISSKEVHIKFLQAKGVLENEKQVGAGHASPAKKIRKQKTS